MSRLHRRLLAGSLSVLLSVVLPLALLVRLGWGSLLRWDDRVVQALALPPGRSRDVALALTQLGEPLLLQSIAVVIAVVLVRRQPRVSVFVLLSVLGAQLVSNLVKGAVGRARPCADAIPCPSSLSFPSGHAVGAAAFWTTVCVLLLPVVGRRAWWLLALPPVVAATRVLLGVHYPSDVLAGLLVGGCWASAWTAALGAWRERPLDDGLP